ncbi:sodium-coupled monocarboxylate transporter 1 isoform X2 [Lycorma delicatula]
MDESSLAIDYIVFVLLICASTSVAVYGRLSGPKERTKADYVFAASSSVSVVAMMLSVARGFLGVRVFLGYPSELFYRGSGMWETLYGMTVAFPLVCFFFVPVYYSLGITSVYQYLDLRFKSRLVRCLASGTYVARSLLNLGVTVFTPCVALKTVIGLPYIASISSIVAISLFFTVMGGLRTAIMADVAQLLVMMGCSVAIIVQGIIYNGGVTPVVKTNYERGRLNFFNFNMDPTQRVSTMSALVGQLFMSLSIFGCQQNFVQRYCSMKTKGKVYQTLMGNMPVMTVLFSMSWVAGMVIFASYANCDPMKLGYIQDIDEILPFYVEDKFYFLPGFLGLIMASLFNGALNLCVSNLNSISTVLWEDFISQLPSMKGLSDRKQLMVIKLLGAICGATVLGFACMVAMLSGVVESSLLVTSATSGPLLGVFVLAMFFPSANWKGAAIGMIISHITVLWVTINGLMIDKPKIPMLPTTTDGCRNDTFSPHIRPLVRETSYYLNLTQSTTPNPIVNRAAPERDFLTSLYMITYMYYSFLGTTITVVLGVIISYFTSSEDDIYDEKLIHPIARKVSNWLPGKKRKYLNSRPTPNSTSTNTTIIPSISEKTEKSEKFKETSGPA